ncbi:MAG: ADP-ribosylglycohydrolase family protein [Clostridia bacterium]|nr:ADP-ribosylglycohydrolase family protein [Clostridia bacterium]
MSFLSEKEPAADKILDAVYGCLLGGAYGDALGYPVEFLKLNQIIDKYGEDGITGLILRNGIAEISDDTQMTLYTANGILNYETQTKTGNSNVSLSSCVFAAYREWYSTQGDPLYFMENNKCWIYNVKTLHSLRAPGNTCLSAIAYSGGIGSIDCSVNNSKGCGGVMRVAPVGCYFAKESEKARIAALEGAQVAALTHGHTLGYIPAAFLSCLIYKIISNKAEKYLLDLSYLVSETYKIIYDMFKGREHFTEFEELIKKAIRLSASCEDDKKCIKELGQGWVAEETLAIALYSSLKYDTDFRKAINCAVNHDGDSDSTGAVTGNISGAYSGLSLIDKDRSFVTKLEANDIIFELSQDLVNGCSKENFDEKWRSKYVDATYGRGK